MKYEVFLKKARDRHGEKYSYKKFDNLNTSEFIEINCPDHGTFSQVMSSHIHRSGCPSCGQINRNLNQAKSNKENGVTYNEFVERARVFHGNRYDYSKTVVNGIKRLCTITCEIHGDFKQMVQAHIINGQGCPDCFKHERLLGERFDSLNPKSQLERVVLNKKGFTISIDDSLSDDLDKKMNCTCVSHNVKFKASQRQLLFKNLKYHCEVCKEDSLSLMMEKIVRSNKSRLLSKDEFIKRSVLAHGDRYCYEISEYSGVNNPLKISCPTHGEFLQTPREHWSGCGCQKCSNSGTSYKEQSWIASLEGNVKPSKRIYYSGKRYYIVDGLDEENGIVYEFLGDYWHGNPEIYNASDVNYSTGKTFGDMHKSTFERLDLIKSLGYQVVYIWENDYDKLH